MEGEGGQLRQVKPFIRTAWTSYESKKYLLYVQTRLEGLRDVSLSLERISDPYILCNALHGSHCLSCEFSGSAKLTPEKQIS